MVGSPLEKNPTICKPPPYISEFVTFEPRHSEIPDLKKLLLFKIPPVCLRILGVTPCQIYSGKSGLSCLID